MNKYIFKIFLKLSLLCICVIFIVLYLSNLFRPDRDDKDNDTKSKVLGFYELKKDSIDILMLGSSHIYYGVNPSLIYKGTNLNSYIFAGECQPIEVSYYYLKEALKTQKPSLLILDVFSQSDSIDMCKTDGIYRVNLENLKDNYNKYQAFSNITNENPINAVFDIYIYHNRWSEINKSENNNFKDFGYTYGYNFSYETIDLDNSYNGEVIVPDDVKLQYIDKIVELCRDNSIDILFIKTPYYLSEIDKGIYEFIENYSTNKNIKFIDFNKIRSDIGYKFNIHGDVWHANVYGSIILSNYLSDFINNNYSISSKNKNIYKDDYIRMNDKLNKIIYSREFDLNNLLKMIEKDNYTLLLNYNYFPNSLIKNNEIKILEKIGYNFSEYPNKKMIIKVKQGKRIEEYYSDEYFYKEFLISGVNYKVEANGYVSKDNIGVNIANNYACISVINEYNGEFIDNFCLDTEGGLYVHRDMLEN